MLRKRNNEALYPDVSGAALCLAVFGGMSRLIVKLGPSESHENRHMTLGHALAYKTHAASDAKNFKTAKLTGSASKEQNADILEKKRKGKD
jgi:hypothetical protein